VVYSESATQTTGTCQVQSLLGIGDNGRNPVETAYVLSRVVENGFPRSALNKTVGNPFAPCLYSAENDLDSQKDSHLDSKRIPELLTSLFIFLGLILRPVLTKL